MKPNRLIPGLLVSLLIACTSSTPIPPSQTAIPATITPGTADTPISPTEIASTQPTQTTSLPTDPPPATPTQSILPAATKPGIPSAAGLPDPSSYNWTLITSGLENPVGITHAGDGSGRLFILEQPGRIRILQDGQVLPQPFLDITPQVNCCGERGLLGLAFHPQYAANGFFYINYTTSLAGQLTSIIARFQVSADPNRADPASEVRLLQVAQPYPNHNGGGLAFGPDGYLYIALGDGGAAGDPEGRGQSLDTLLGKILRLDADRAEPYAIPPDNPFASGGGLPEIWLYGLRNPWRFSFDRLTGDLYIGDVGQGSWEEIDYMPAHSPGGGNFGWDYFEGSHPYEGAPPPGLELLPPVAEYSHGDGISVTGGYVYRGANLPGFQGVYTYGDYGSGKVWGLLHLPDDTWQSALLFEIDANISSFGEDETGEIYLVDYRGNIFRLEGK